VSSLRKYLIAGLLVWLPLIATVVVIRFLINLLDKTILLIPPEWRPETVFGFSIPGFGIMVGIFILLITGMFAANLFGRRLVAFWESLLGRIPLVRTIYNSVKQVTETIFTSNSKSFRKAVLIEFPRKGTWSVGFLSNRGMQTAIDITGQELISVFVSTTPNPTTGFIMMVPASEVIELDISIEEAFKYIISIGVVVPNEHAKNKLVNSKLAQN
jgi:uncharacterized membrane protein